MLSKRLYYSLLVVFSLLLASCGGGEGNLYGDSNDGNDHNSRVQSPEVDGDATHFYLSYDDSASTASRDLTLAAIQNGITPQSSWGRAYEYLNAEVFEHFSPEVSAPFEISMGVFKALDKEIPINAEYDGDMYALGINITGPTLLKSERPNVVLTLLVDISASMDSAYSTETQTDIRTLLDVTKHGLSVLPNSLKDGDIINLVTFETEVDTVLSNWSFDQDNTEFLDAVESLETEGQTNLNAGLVRAYQVANASYDPDKANRVIMLTDAYLNSGEVSLGDISKHTVINGREGILFAGIGIGDDFNDTVLNTLTEAGKSVYSAMITPEDATRIFTEGFMRFVDHAVENIQFRLDYPQSLNQLRSASEEISTDADELDTVNYAYNSQQFFLELFSSESDVDVSDTVKLTITFDDVNDESQTIYIEKTLEALLANGEAQIRSAAMVSLLAELVAGNLSCDIAINSKLYTEEMDTEVFSTYYNAIEDYCAQA